MSLKNQKKNNKLLRGFIYSNIHEIKCNIEKITLFYVKKENIALKTLIKVSTLLELVTKQRAFFLRSKKSLASLKIRRGLPVGLKVTLRKSVLSFFLFKLIWQILPNIKNFYCKLKFKLANLKKINTLTITIPSALNFFELQSFYFFFKGFNNLTITLSFPATITKNELFFSARVSKIPF